MVEWARRAVGALGLAALGWGAFWLIAATLERQALLGWAEGRVRAGWQAEIGDLAITGFPLAFERRLTDVALADPGAGWAWAAPLVLGTSRALAPNRLTLILPPRQTLAVPGARAVLESAALDAMIDFAPDSRLGLREAQLSGRDLALRGAPDWAAQAERLDARIALRGPDSGPGPAYDLDLSGGAIGLPPALVAMVDPTGALVPRAERLVLDATLVLDRPLDLAALEAGRIVPRSLVLAQAALGWGRMELVLQGRLDLDADGYPRGRLTARARHWRDMVALARRAGALGPDQARVLSGALEIAALFGGADGAIELPLDFADRAIRLGPVRLGPAPRLVDPAR